MVEWLVFSCMFATDYDYEHVKCQLNTLGNHNATKSLPYRVGYWFHLSSFSQDNDLFNVTTSICHYCHFTAHF